MQRHIEPPDISDSVMRVACRTTKSGPYESSQNHLAVTACQICQHRSVHGPERISIDAHYYLESPLSECGCTRGAIETNPQGRVVADSRSCLRPDRTAITASSRQG